MAKNVGVRKNPLTYFATGILATHFRGVLAHARGVSRRPTETFHGQRFERINRGVEQWQH